MGLFELSQCKNCFYYAGMCVNPKGKFFASKRSNGSGCKYFKLLEKYVWSAGECASKVRNGAVVFVGEMTTENADKLVRDLSYASGIFFDYYEDRGKVVIGVVEFNESIAKSFILEHIHDILREYCIKNYL